MATTTIFPAIAFADDIGNHVTVNVTTLMREAQNPGLQRFQLRLLKGSGGTTTGLIEINDTTADLAPLLTVAYF